MNHGGKSAYERHGCRCDPCRAWNAAKARRGYARNPEPRRATSRRYQRRNPLAAEASRRRDRRHAARTLARAAAARSGARWTPAEDAEIVATLHRPALEVAMRLSRTLGGVEFRRHTLRQKGLTPA